MGRIRDDLKYGKKAEAIVKPILETKFGELTQDPNPYANFDFFNEKYCVEHKQRNIPFGRYDSLMFDSVKYKKYLKLRQEGKRCFIVWSLSTGKYIWEFEDQFRGDDAVFHEQVKSINRVTHTQVTDVVCVFNEFIKPFSEFNI